MTAESASTAISGTRRGIRILSVTMAVAVGCIAVWYRATFHAWPGQQGSRVHWCGRDYEYFGQHGRPVMDGPQSGPRIRPLVGTPVPAVTSTGPSPFT
jgi:hypothetical protein